MDELQAVFTLERDTKRTRRFAEEAGDRPPIIGTIYVQQWALKKLTGDGLPGRIRVKVMVESEG
jgi:hypothetical protein